MRLQELKTDGGGLELIDSCSQTRLAAR